MSGGLNAADRVVAHAIGALASGYHPAKVDVAMYVDIVRDALPHTSERLRVMHALLPVAIELIALPADWQDGSGSWSVWRWKACKAVVEYHRYELGAAQERMTEALQRRVA